MEILTIDIGGTYIKYAGMGENAEILFRGKVPTPQTGREDLLNAIEAIWAEAQNPAPAGIAISMPGIIDRENGHCVLGGALRYNDDFNIRDALLERCPTRIVIENDAKCAATAEACMGSLQDVRDGLVLLFGTMIGGGIIHDHKVIRGRHFSAGEVSYILPYAERKPCRENVWGNCNGTPRLCGLYAERKGLDLKSVNGHVFFDAVSAGDRVAVECLDEFTRGAAVQIFNLQTILDPERVAIGGGISAQPAFIESIRKNLDELYAECPYPLPHAEIVPCTFQNDANLIGAVQCFLEAYRSEI